MRLNIYIVLFLSSFSHLANSSELVRAGQTNSPSTTTVESATATARYEPFFEACRSKDKTQKTDTIEAISPMKYGVPQIVQSDEKGQSAFDLINEAYKTAQSKLKNNLEQAQSALSCIDEVFEKNISEISSRCHKTSQDIQEAALANQRARYALAMGLPSQKVLNELQYNSLNTELNTPVTSFKVAQWNPLSVSESEFVSKTWDNFIKKTDEEVKEKVKDHFNFSTKSVSLDYKKNLIQQKRSAAMMNYHLDISRYPLIQFLKSDQPQKDEFKIAYSEVVKNIQNEMENIKTKQNNLVLNPKKQVNTDDLFILNYQTTEDVLSGQPKYCSIAQSLMEFQKKKQMYISAGSAIAFVGASLTGQIPAAVIFATGSALSGYNTYEAYVKYKAAMQAHLAATTFDDQILRKKAVDEEKSETVLQGTLTVGSAALSLPLKMSQVIPQARLTARAQVRELIEGEPYVIQPLSAEKKRLLEKINSLEKDALQAFSQTGTELLTNSGRGIGKEVLFKSRGGIEGRGFILKHVFEDEKTWAIVAQKTIVNGQVRVVQVRVPAMETLPVKKP